MPNTTDFIKLVGQDGAVQASMSPIVRLDLGAADADDADGYCALQDLTAAGVASVDTDAAGAIAAAALAGSADVPRNVVAGWTGTAVLTVTGTDYRGEVMTESSASGTTFAGKKAFATVTDISVSVDVTGLTVGTGDVLGIPLVLTGKYDVLSFYADTTEEAATATFVAADKNAATATTGDVRGTVSPATAPNGSANFYLWMHVQNPDTDRNLYGQDQA